MLHTFILFCLCHLVDPDEVNVVSVMEGESVTLYNNVTDENRYYGDRQFWTGPEGTRIVRVMWQHEPPDIKYTQNERFRDRLQIDNQTGSLTIRMIRTTDSGLYQKHSPFSGDLVFNITVYARLPIPIITRDSPQCSSPSGSCSLLCSVVNVSHVTLSWFKGHILISSISVSDLSFSLSLPLDFHCLDDLYRCVLNNPISSRTQLLNSTELCPPFPDSAQRSFSFTEAVIRLVIAAVVGVAAVAIVIYDVTSRSGKHHNQCLNDDIKMPGIAQFQ